MEKVFSNIYNEQSCGRSGNGSIDLFSGNLTFVHELVKYEGLNLPIDLSIIYSTYSSSYSDRYQMPGSWRFNFMQSLRPDDSDNLDNEDPSYESYIYEDASGRTQTISKRYYRNLTTGSGDSLKTFKRYGFTHDASDVLSEISNDQYILTKSGNNKILSDKAGNKLRFNSDGLLVSIEKAEATSAGGPKMTFSYNANQIVIMDASGRKAYINFENGVLSSLTCNDIIINFNIGDYNRLNRISYFMNNDLQNVEHFTEFVYYSLNEKVHKLISVKDISGLKIDYTYPEVSEFSKYSPVTGYKIGSTSSMIMYDDNPCKGVVSGYNDYLESVSINYNCNGYGNLTKITDIFGAEKYYFFKSDGSLHISYDDRGNQQIHSLNTNFFDESRTNEGIEYMAQSKIAEILNTSRNLINPGFATSLKGIPSGSQEYGYNIAGEKLASLEEGWYVFSVEAKGELNQSSYFSSRFQAGDIPYLALWIWGTYNITVITAEKFTKFDDKNSDWQIAALPFYLNKKNLESLKLYITLNRNDKDIQLRNWSLRKASGFTDNIVDGNKEVSLSDGKTNTTVDITKRNNNTRVTSIKPEGADAIENTVHYHSIYGERVLIEDNGLGYKKTYDYDTYGNVTCETIEDIKTGQKMLRQYNYDFSDSRLNKNAIRYYVDESGKRITSDYSVVTGLLKRTILPGTNQNIDYAYKGVDKLFGEIKAISNESAQIAETANKLYYNAGYLTRMEHNGFKYDLIYDGFGRVTKVNADGSEILSTTYVNNGNDIDGVTGAKSKTVTCYSKILPKAGLFCGEINCGDVRLISGQFSPSSNIICGQVLCGQAVCGYESQESEYNNVFASYYNKYGELIKVRYKINAKLNDNFTADDDYITVTYLQDSYNRKITYQIGDIRHLYNYNPTSGELVDRTSYRGSTQELKFEVTGKDVQHRITGVKYTIDNNDELCYNYTYKSPYEDIIKTVSLPNNKKSTVETDAFGRIMSRAINTTLPFTETYEYKTNDVYTTPLVYVIKQKVGGNITGGYRYTYDENNNITEIVNVINNQLIASYKYDGLNRLKCENIVGQTITIYYYDAGGNITHKKIFDWQSYYSFSYEQLLALDEGTVVYYSYTETGNRDSLISYRGSETMEYDVYGNPKSWFKHGSSNSALKYKLKWIHGKELAYICDLDNGESYSYEYNDEGIRTRKIVGNITYKYYLDGKRIIAETRGTNKLQYYYDAMGICGFSYNGADYFFQKNFYGDIIRIYNGNGMLYGEYSYDVWGKCTINTDIDGIASINSFRYRGYYFDSETALYYLNSRYYDPEIGRFISPDSPEFLDPEGLNGLNLYAYCLNNPVMYIDPEGNFVWFVAAAFVIGFVLNTVTSVASQAMTNNGKIDFGVALIDGLFGGLSMAASVIPGIGTVAGAFIDFGLSVANNLITTGMQNDWNITMEDIGNAFLNGAMDAGFSIALDNLNISMKNTKAFNRAKNLTASVSKKIKNGTYYLNKSISAGGKAVRNARRDMLNAIGNAFTTKEAFFAYGASFAQSILSNLLF